MSIDIQASLYHYNLALVEREDHLYCLIDLQTGEWYEKMTIYYIEKLLRRWHKFRTEAIKVYL